jgi:hypothetical protein
VTIKFRVGQSIPIMIGSALFFDESIPVTHEKDCFRVGKITKCLDGRRYDTDQAVCTPTLLGNVTYELEMDRNVPDHLSEYTMVVWKITSVYHKIPENL